MRRSMKVLTGIGILILIISLRFNVLAQVGPPPPPTGGHGQTSNLPPEGGSAPVGNGIAFLISLGVGYLVLRYSAAGQGLDEEVTNEQ